MASEYERLFVRDMPPTKGDFDDENEPDNLGEGHWVMSDKLVPEAQINMTHIWVHESDQPELWVHPHVHDYDEVLIWTGGDPEHPHDLGAELYMDIEGERHIITTSGSVYIPAGTVHCPLGWNKVERPWRFSALSLSPSYATVKKDEGAAEA